MTTVFGKIIRNETPSEKLYEDDKCIVIKDINPAAETHWLIIPKKEILSISEMKEEDIPLIGHCVWVAKKMTMNNLVTNRVTHMSLYSVAFNIDIPGEFLTQRTLTDFAFRERELAKLRRHIK